MQVCKYVELTYILVVVQYVEEHQRSPLPDPVAGNPVVEKSFWQGWYNEIISRRENFRVSGFLVMGLP